MYEFLEGLFSVVVEYGIMALECIGAILILISAVRALIDLLQRKTSVARLCLYEGITMALSFLLGGEVLKTITTRDWQAIGMTCAVLLMRAVMVILLHWEKKHED